MKILFVSKKIIIFTLILLIFIILFLTFIFFYYSTSIPTSTSTISIISEDTINRITNLPNQKEKVAYLTFDDGPSANITPKILDILKEEDIKATFFVIGKYVDEYPEITKRAYEDGHYIANHTYDHNNKILYKNSESFINEVKKTDTAISNAIGVQNYSSHVFRFPTGFMSKNNKQAKKSMLPLLYNLGYTYIDWNCLNNDSMKKYTKEQLLNNLKKTSKNKDTLVILMHDTKFVSDSSIALKESIEYLKSQGYAFKNFYDIL